MGMTTGFLTKALTATAAVGKRLLVAYGAADGTCVQASGATAKIVGVSENIDHVAGERVSVFKVGNTADVVYGGTVARGDPITSDANGRAIKATAAGQYCVGDAEVSGVVGDIGSVDIHPYIL
jgi:hypothetical protein